MIAPDSSSHRDGHIIQLESIGLDEPGAELLEDRHIFLLNSNLGGYRSNICLQVTPWNLRKKQTGSGLGRLSSGDIF